MSTQIKSELLPVFAKYRMEIDEACERTRSTKDRVRLTTADDGRIDARPIENDEVTWSAYDAGGVNLLFGIRGADGIDRCIY